MTRQAILWWVLGAVGLTGLGYLANQVGGIAIRGVGDTAGQVTLEVSAPAILGVDTVVHWSTARQASESKVNVAVRTLSGEQVVGEALLSDGQVTVQIPCNVGTDRATIVLNAIDELGNEQLLVWREVEVLPPGPDCLR